LKERKLRRLPSFAPVMILFLLLALRAIPSDPAVPSRSQLLPELEQQHARQQLALLLASRAIFSPGTGIVSPQDLATALGGPRRRLGLFRPESAVDGRIGLLRAIPFGDLLLAAGQRHHVDSLLLAAVVEAESQFSPRAVSPCGAVGLMQLLPETAREYGAGDLLEPSANIEAGSRYLRAMLDRFKERPDLALAAYNTGPEVVARYGCVPPYRETQEFVRRVLSRYARHRTDLGLQPLGFEELPASAGGHKG
jgi:soluble lytic murein transglycosylase-like protein